MHSIQMLEEPSIRDIKFFKDYLDSNGYTSILPKLGIFGWEEYEKPILSYLLLGGSILLVGEHGTSKSRLARKLADALGVSSAKYDASKDSWDYIVGFPDPAKLMNIELRENSLGIPIIETATSIWGKRFLLVDELNRCSVDMQGQWLEVILDQTLMGQPIGSKWIVSAMNPGYIGTNPLDMALVSRFLYFIQVPKATMMTENNLHHMLDLNNPEEYPAKNTWDLMETDDYYNLYINDDMKTNIEKEDFSKASILLKCLLFTASNIFNLLEEKFGRDINSYLISTIKSLSTEANYYTDGRRIRMMKNAILGMASVDSATRRLYEGNISKYDIADIALQVLYLSYPLVAGVDSPSRIQLETAHNKALYTLEDTSSPIYKINIETNPINKLDKLFGYEDRDSILTYKILNDVLKEDTEETNIIAYCLLVSYADGLDLDIQCINIIADKVYNSLLQKLENSQLNTSIDTIEKQRNLVPAILLGTNNNLSFLEVINKQLQLVYPNYDCETYLAKVIKMLDKHVNKTSKIDDYIYNIEQRSWDSISNE